MQLLRILSLLVALAASITPDQECQYSLQNLEQNILNPAALTTWDYGVLIFPGKGIADMGSRGMCELLQMNYIYLTYEGAAMGMCFYPYCSTEYLNTNKATILQMLSLILPIPPEAYPLVNFTTESQIAEKVHDDVRNGYIATTVVLVLFGAICLFGVIVQCTHLCDKRAGLADPKTDNEIIENKSKLGLLCLSFSAWFNFKNLLKTGGKGASYDPNLEVFAGVRTFAMMYVVLGHVGQGMANGINNDFMGLLATWFGTFLKGAQFSVDVFFLMAAFLATYVMMGKFSKGGWINPLLVYFHRWWRLIFPLIFAMIIGAYLIPYFMRGPFIQQYQHAITDKCNKYWWSNLLFINNFYPWDLNDECLPHVWYLANDWQFFLLLPFILMIFKRSAPAGYLVLTALLGVSVALSSYFTMHYQLTIPTAKHDTGSIYYIKPYCRIPPYLLGILLGYWYHQRKQFKLGKAEDSLGNKVYLLYQRSGVWTWISAIIGVTLTSVNIFIYHTAVNGSGWKLEGVATYNAISRLAFVLGMMMVLLPTFEGRLTWVKYFMSCEYFQVIGKLTYSAYLIHIPVGVAYIYCQKYTAYGAVDNIVYHYFGMYTLSYLCALILFLLAEYPPLNIERFILFPKKKQPEFLLPGKHMGSDSVKQ